MTLIKKARNQILITMIVVKNHLKLVHVDDCGGDILLTIFFWLDDKNHLKPVHVDDSGSDGDDDT